MLDFLVIYLILWWLVFFVMLPFGIERDQDVRFGNDPGAPKKTLVKKRRTSVLLFFYFIRSGHLLNSSNFHAIMQHSSIKISSQTII